VREERPVPSLQISLKINLPSDTGEENFTGDFVGDSTREGAMLAAAASLLAPGALVLELLLFIPCILNLCCFYALVIQSGRDRPLFPWSSSAETVV
jgi:hypothetical protein